MVEQYTNEELVRLYNKEKEKKNIYNSEQILQQIFDKNHGVIETRISIWSVYKKDLTYHEKEELRHLAKIAIWEAVESYDNTRGTAFITYAVWKIDSKIRDWLRDEHLIHIPDAIQSYCSKYKDIITRYQQKNNGETPSEEYIRKLLDVGEKTFQSIKAALKIYEITRFDEEDDKVHTQVEEKADDKDILLDILISENAEEFSQIIWKLKNRNERIVIIEHFYNDMEYVEIAKRLKVTKQRVNTIQKKAFEHLRAMPEVINIAKEIGIRIKPLDS